MCTKTQPPTEDYAKCSKSFKGKNGWTGCDAALENNPDYCSWQIVDSPDDNDSSWPDGNDSGSSDSSANYIRVDYDDCESQNYFTITSVSQCMSAAAALSGSSDTVQSEDVDQFPTGCYAMIVLGDEYVYFNERSTGDPCSSDNVCFCAKFSGGGRRLLANDHFGIQQWAEKTLIAPHKQRMLSGDFSSTGTCQAIWTGLNECT